MRNFIVFSSIVLLVLLAVASRQDSWMTGILRGMVSEGLEEGCDLPIDQEVFDLVSERGFKTERHEVTTEDGYVLTLHRLVGALAPTKGPVLFVPGAMCSSAAFLMNDRNQSLGYIVSDAGYDVWLLNQRGTAYSLKHRNLSCTKPQFWDFSFDQTGRLDMASAVDYVLDTTQKEKLSTICHSLGCTETVVLLSSRPEYNKKMSSAVFLSPGLNRTNDDSTFRLISSMATMQGVKNGPVLKNYNMINQLALASRNSYLAYAALQLIQQKLADEEDPLFFDKSRIGTYLYFFPRVISLKMFTHLQQILDSHKFRRFDEGRQGNLIKYNQTEPPGYDFHLVTAPVVIIAGENDKKIPVEMLRPIKDSFPNLIGFWVVPKASHADFAFTINPKAAMFPQILDVLDRSLNKTNTCTSGSKNTKFQC